MASGPAKTASAPKNSPATVTVPALKIYVRETFYASYSGGQGECWYPGSGIAGLTFEIDGKAVTGKKATTNKPHKVSAGLVMTIPLYPDPTLQTRQRVAARAKSTEATEATLSLAGVTDGEHVLTVIPDGKQSSTDPAGPSTSSTESRLYRPLSIRFSSKKGQLASAEEFDPDDASAEVSHGHVTAFKDDELCIDLKPDWLKTTAGVKKRKKPIDLIVIHHTGDKTIGSALSEALVAKGPHYEIDPEGHVVKFVNDDCIAAHAGPSCWDGKTSCNENAIGIEIVHWQPKPKDKTPQPPVTEPQYASLLALLGALIEEHQLEPHRIVAHSDVRTTDDDKYLLGSARPNCPGPMFEWTRLEAEKLGMIPKAGIEVEDDWGGYFESYSDPLRSGDSDKKKIFGGKKRKDVSGVIVELQRDLLGIGYSVKVNGEFDKYTRQAVDRFKRHFFTGTRKSGAPPINAVSDQIDKDTASMILAVRMGLPGAPTKAAPKPGMLTPEEGDEGEADHTIPMGSDGAPRAAGTEAETPKEQTVATRVRMVGMMFDANKCFLLPQALPGIKIVIDMHRQHESAEVLIVGHAEGDEELAGMDIALARAEMLAAYLTSKPNPWLAWFDESKPKQSRWGTREVQLMLSALPQGGDPFYKGNASGITGDRTVAAVKAFQQHYNKAKGGNLVVDGMPGSKTCEALVTAYMDLEDTTLAADIVPATHGCEGHFDDTITADGLQPDDRRIEVFFFDKTIDPKPAGKTSSAGSSGYPEWIKKLTETKSFEHHGIHVRIVDGSKRPIAGAKVTYEGPTGGEAETDDHGFVSLFGLKAGEYTIHATRKGLSIPDTKLTYPTAKTVPFDETSESDSDDGARAPEAAEDVPDLDFLFATTDE